MTLSDWLSLLAIVLGPLFGVALAHHLQDRAFAQGRRMDIFRTLMRTRRTPMYPEHVGALNLVEIEFAKDNNVISAWRNLFKHLGTQHPRRPDEVVEVGADQQEAGARDHRYGLRLYLERQSLLAKLLDAMAKALDFKIDQLEIFEGGYTPQGWSQIEDDQTAIRRFAAQLAAGQRALPIAVLDYTNVAHAANTEPKHSQSPGATAHET
jgi:hypothetical protein